MAIRDDIIANVTTQLASLSVGVTSELPFDSGGTPLYVKNKKHFYISEASQDNTQEYSGLDGSSFTETETTLTGYIAVDAKTQPSDIETVVERCIASKNVVSGNYIRECDLDTEIIDDRIDYTFEFRFVKLT
jgi:hypothetical protein